MREQISPDRLEAYLDGRLSRPDRQRTEAVIEADANLRRHVLAQRLIDDSLRRQFEPSNQPAGRPAVHAAGRSLASAGRQLAGRIPFRRLGALSGLAAALAIAVFVQYRIRVPAGFDLPEHNPAVSLVERLYRVAQADGWTPAVAFDSREGFSAAVEARFGMPLNVEPDPGTEVLGWRDMPETAVGVSPESMLVYARVKGSPVLLIIDRIENDTMTLAGRRNSTLSFRAACGSLVVYEVTPLRYAYLLYRFFDPRDPMWPMTSHGGFRRACLSAGPDQAAPTDQPTADPGDRSDG